VSVHGSMRARGGREWNRGSKWAQIEVRSAGPPCLTLTSPSFPSLDSDTAVDVLSGRFQGRSMVP
jgi:hypothetical protein